MLLSFNFTVKSALVAALFASQALGIPFSKHAVEKQSVKKHSTCTNKSQRKAWHTLADSEKTAYIDAELCLMWDRPAQTGREGVVSRYDDFVKTHQIQTDWIHQDGIFLPWHRLFMHAHEHALQTECNYTGTQPYWDEARDAGKYNESVVFYGTVNFGGNGNGTDGVAGCITDGPFANLTLHIGPEQTDTDHCLKRNFNETIGLGSAQSEIDACLAETTIEEAWPCIAHQPHVGTHGGVGGELSDLASSPGDPVFYLHHTFLDRVWWQWQAEDLDNRLYIIDGYTSMNEPATGWVNATLEDVLDMFGIVPNATIADVVDIAGNLLCYEYV